MASSVFLSDVQVFNTNGGASIDLTVIIGDAQVGGTSVDLNNSLVAAGQINDLPIPGPFQFDRLNCITTVKDVNPATNNTSVTYVLNAGGESQSFPYSIAVNQTNGQAVYSVTFILA